MKSKPKLLVSVMALVLLAGCAAQVRVENSEGEDVGVEFYLPEPYLLVSETEASKLKFEIKYLPNPCERRTIKLDGGFGTATMKPTLQDGWMLTGLEATVDSKVSELITAAGGVLLFDKAVDEVGYYPLKFDESGVLVGFGKKVGIPENNGGLPLHEACVEKSDDTSS